MDAATLLLILAIAGVNFGWQAVSDGEAGYEYIVQVEPELADAMQRGDAVPIESNIPADVAPIRKVRVVVGRGDLPREPLRHTANFAGQPGWTPDRYSTPPAAATPNRYSGQSASLVDRTATAFSESGSAISDGFQAGIRSAQDQLSRTGSQVVNDTQQAAQQFGQQLRSATEQTFDATSNQVRQAGNSLGLSGGSNPPPASSNTRGVSAPPWPQATASTPTPSSSLQNWPTSSPVSRELVTDTTSSPGMAMTRTATGWTSIGTNVAAPPLLNPPLTTTTSSNRGFRIAQNDTTGPSLSPPASPTSREPIHSVLVDPSRHSATTNSGVSDWGNSWTTGGTAAPATIGRSSDSSRGNDAAGNSGLVPVQPRYANQQNTQQAADRWSDPWAETDPWKQQQQQQPGQSSLPRPPAKTNESGSLATSNSWPENTSNMASPGISAEANQPIISQPPPATTAGFGSNKSGQNGTMPPVNPAVANNGANPEVTAAQPPWMPLLLVSLSLIGSLSANFYLALSYIGARQRYVSLVQKTANAFRRAADAAA